MGFAIDKSKLGMNILCAYGRILMKKNEQS